jgi:hypothetical protein
MRANRTHDNIPFLLHTPTHLSEGTAPGEVVGPSMTVSFDTVLGGIILSSFSRSLVLTQDPR